MGERDEDEDRTAALHRDAAAVWPNVRVARERFSEAVAAALGAGQGGAQELHASDLYLVLGCLDGQGPAIAAFERHFIEPVRLPVARACRGSSTTVEDVMQWTRQKLLVGEPPKPPKIAQYTGRGALLGWVRVVAVREALQDRRKTKRESAPDDVNLLGTGEGDARSFEAMLLRERHAAAFRAAVVEALRRLTPEQRTLLRFHTHEGLNIDQLAPMLGVHRATAARRLEKARADVLEYTRSILSDRHGLSDSEARSLCIALADEVDVSVARALDYEAAP